MILVMYHPKQDKLRLYLTACQCWEDMLYVYTPKRHATSIEFLLDWGWELVGTL